MENQTIFKEHNTFRSKVINDDMEKENAKLYLDVPNISNKDTPKEIAVGALEINPNTPDRVSKVLDNIILSADMENKFSVKIVFEGNEVRKVINACKESRKFVVGSYM